VYARQLRALAHSTAIWRRGCCNAASASGIALSSVAFDGGTSAMCDCAGCSSGSASCSCGTRTDAPASRSASIRAAVARLELTLGPELVPVAGAAGTSTSSAASSSTSRAAPPSTMTRTPRLRPGFCASWPPLLPAQLAAGRTGVAASSCGGPRLVSSAAIRAARHGGTATAEPASPAINRRKRKPASRNGDVEWRCLPI
jgi:hypothetical protein